MVKFSYQIIVYLVQLLSQFQNKQLVLETEKKMNNLIVVEK